MTVIEFKTPAPYCLIPALHPARKATYAADTDIARTFRQHREQTPAISGAEDHRHQGYYQSQAGE